MILIALTLAAAHAAPIPPPLEVEIVRDAITDRQRVTATLRGNRERIVISCEAPDWTNVKVSYHSGRWLARGNWLAGEEPITFRFDAHPPQRHFWRVRDRTASISSRDRVFAFLQALRDARRLVVRARDIEYRSFDSAFEIGDSSPAIAALLDVCG